MEKSPQTFGANIGIDHEHFDIEVIEKELLNAAKKHIGQLPQDYRVDYTASRGYR